MENMYSVKPAKDAPTYFWTLVYNVKAIIPGEIAANKTQKRKSLLKEVLKKKDSSIK